MFTEIATRYKGKSWAPDSLAKKIRSGGSGVWGEVNMPAHPSITANDAKTIINYILNIEDKNISTLPLKGSYTARIPEGDNGKGSIVVRAAYTDRGASSTTTLTTEKQIVLRSPNLSPGNADVFEKAKPKLQTMFAVSMIVIPNPNGSIGFKQIDFSGIKQMELSAMAMPRMGYVGGSIEVRLDSPTGDVIGQTEIIAKDPVFAPPTANSVQNAGGAKAKPAPKKKAAPFNPFASPGIKLQIKPISGVHDLYFVFKNDKAKPDDQLMSFSNISLTN